MMAHYQPRNATLCDCTCKIIEKEVSKCIPDSVALARMQTIYIVYDFVKRDFMLSSKKWPKLVQVYIYMEENVQGFKNPATSYREEIYSLGGYWEGLAQNTLQAGLGTVADAICKSGMLNEDKFEDKRYVTYIYFCNTMYI